MFFSNVSIVYRGGGWDAQWDGVGCGGVGGGKNICLGHPMSSHDVYTVANATLVDHKKWEQTQVPTTQFVPSIGFIVPDMALKSQQESSNQEGWIDIIECVCKPLQ